MKINCAFILSEFSHPGAVKDETGGLSL